MLSRREWSSAISGDAVAGRRRSRLDGRSTPASVESNSRVWSAVSSVRTGRAGATSSSGKSHAWQAWCAQKRSPLRSGAAAGLRVQLVTRQRVPFRVRPLHRRPTCRCVCNGFAGSVRNTSR